MQGASDVPPGDASGPHSASRPVCQGVAGWAVQYPADKVPRRSLFALPAAAAIGPRACIAALPDEVLVRVFANVPFCERHNALPLVCKQWRALAATEPGVWAAIELNDHAEHDAALKCRRTAKRLCSGLPSLHWLAPRLAAATSLTLRWPFLGASDAWLDALMRQLTAAPTLTQLRLQSSRLPPRPFLAALPSLSTLRSLQLESRLTLGALPQLDPVSTLTTLEVLVLSVEGPLLSLPDFVSALTALTRLTLAAVASGKEIRAVLRSGASFVLPPWTAASLGRLASLSLAGVVLPALPRSLAALPALRALSLVGNPLPGGFAAYPSQLSELSALEVLQLDAVSGPAPEVLAQLLALTRLDLSRSRTHDAHSLSALPFALTRLSRLESLSCQWNQALCMADPSALLTVACLSSLAELNLTACGLSALPDAFTRLARLRRLHLACNSLRRLPAFLYRLPRLQLLDVSNNQLLEVDESVLSLLQLPALSSGARCVVDFSMQRDTKRWSVRAFDALAKLFMTSLAMAELRGPGGRGGVLAVLWLRSEGDLEVLNEQTQRVHYYDITQQHAGVGLQAFLQRVYAEVHDASATPQQPLGACSNAGHGRRCDSGAARAAATAGPQESASSVMCEAAAGGGGGEDTGEEVGMAGGHQHPHHPDPIASEAALLAALQPAPAPPPAQAQPEVDVGAADDLALWEVQD